MRAAFSVSRPDLGRLLLGVFGMMLTLSRALHAQPVRGTISDSTTGLPVAGAVVTLLDAAGASVARILSSERGLYYFAARDNASSLRIQRIGYRARTIALPSAAGDITTQNVVLARLPTLLAPMQVVDKGCQRRSDEGSALSLLEQARIGLLATVVARKAMPSSQVLIRFERVMDGTSSHIVSQSVQVDSAAGRTSSFESAHSATDFVTRGFTDTVEGESIFHAPDADVLLNDDFVAAYCFQLAKSEKGRVNQVGLAFHAVRSVRNRVDVEGALWIDTVVRAIREIEFQYKGLRTEVERMNPGGTISFREMTSGVVLIDRWTLRLVGVQPETVTVARRPLLRYRLRITETGGELARAVWADGFTWHASLGALVLHASTENQLPAANTMLRLANTNYGGITDSLGTLRIPYLIPGTYKLAVVDPRLSSIGVDIDTPVSIVAVRDSTYTRAFRVKTAEEYVSERCRRGRETVDTSAAGWIAGRIVGDASHSVDALRISLSHQTISGNWVSMDNFYETASDGLFFVCMTGARDNQSIRLEVRRQGTVVKKISGVLNALLTILRIPLQ